MLKGASFVGFIPVRDTAAAREFYGGVLGLEVVSDDPFAVAVRAGGTVVRLTAVGDYRPQPFTVAGWAVTDIVAAADALRAAGVPLTRFEGMEQDEGGVWAAPGGARVAWFSDPDGNVLSITQEP